MSQEKQASVAPSRTHQVEGMLPRVLPELGRGVQGSCPPWTVHQRIVSCSHNSQEQGGGSRVLSKESQCIVNRIKGAGKPHLSLTNVSPGHRGARPPPTALSKGKRIPD